MVPRLEAPPAPESGTHRLELEVAEAGLSLYAFTFISCPTAQGCQSAFAMLM